MHSAVVNCGRMMRKPRSIKNLKELHAAISEYSSFSFRLSSSESILICRNLFRNAVKDANRRILQISESISCIASFLYRKEDTRNLRLRNRFQG
jgi:hypothetical protein